MRARWYLNVIYDDLLRVFVFFLLFLLICFRLTQMTTFCCPSTHKNLTIYLVLVILSFDFSFDVFSFDNSNKSTQSERIIILMWNCFLHSWIVFTIMKMCSKAYTAVAVWREDAAFAILLHNYNGIVVLLKTHWMRMECEHARIRCGFCVCLLSWNGFESYSNRLNQLIEPSEWVLCSEPELSPLN